MLFIIARSTAIEKRGDSDSLCLQIGRLALYLSVMDTCHYKRTVFDWKLLPRPFSVMAPMEHVTDSAFRRLVDFCGAPDVRYTEFMHVDKLCAGSGEDLRNRSTFHADERPLIAQIWGNRPGIFHGAVRRLMNLGFDGVDINMGCSVPKVLDKGCGAALMKDPSLARELLLAAKEAARGRLAVSVKTRLGFDRVEPGWTEFLLAQEPAALIVHGRVATQRWQEPADWESIGAVVTQRDTLGNATALVGNGDVTSCADIQARYRDYGVDGVMVGRAVLKNPFLFCSDGRSIDSLSAGQRIELLWLHARFCQESLDESIAYTVLKKYVKRYITTFQGAAELRAALVKAGSFDEAHSLLDGYLGRMPGKNRVLRPLTS
jgi:tRNA-dihydrouridine synthase